jgi:hypothetical protein
MNPALIIAILEALPILIRGGQVVASEVDKLINGAPPESREELRRKWAAVKAEIDLANEEWEDAGKPPVNR